MLRLNLYSIQKNIQRYDRSHPYYKKIPTPTLLDTVMDVNAMYWNIPNNTRLLRQKQKPTLPSKNSKFSSALSSFMNKVTAHENYNYHNRYNLYICKNSKKKKISLFKREGEHTPLIPRCPSSRAQLFQPATILYKCRLYTYLSPEIKNTYTPFKYSIVQWATRVIPHYESRSRARV